MFMRTIKSISVSVCAVLAMLVCGAQSMLAQSPFRFGVKAGVTINEMKFNEDAFSSRNRSGFTAGGMLQFVAPVINLGFDASVMYTHRSSRVVSDAPGQADGKNHTDVSVNRGYIEIPVNLRYNILPLFGKIVTPFVTTGPDFSFIVSGKNVKNAWKSKKVDVAWNFGFGLKLLNKVELAASYGLGLNNSASGEAALYGKNPVDGKNRFWTVTAAWLF